MLKRGNDNVNLCPKKSFGVVKKSPFNVFFRARSGQIELASFLRFNLYKIIPMAKYSKKAQDKVEKVMHEKKKGTLRSGSGKKVTSRKQAIAIGLSEARKAGAKVPKKKTAKA
jgi:Family of unknown function (DUF6496)